MEILETVFCTLISAFAFLVFFYLWGRIFALLNIANVDGFLMTALGGFLLFLGMLSCVALFFLMMWIPMDFFIGSGKPITYLINRYF